MPKSRRILFIGPVFPEPTSSAAGSRTHSLLECFRSRGDSILFASASDQNAFSERLRENGIKTVKIGPNDPEFDCIVKEFSPEVVVFDRFMLEEQFGWRVSEVAPDALRILDTIDLHFLRRVRGDWLKAALAGKGEGAAIEDAEFTRISHSLDGIETTDCLRELASLYRSDLSLILSRFEMRLLIDRFHVDPTLLQFLGFSYPEPEPSKWPRIENTRNFVSIGNFRHLPNRDATYWLARELWPKIREELSRKGEAEVEFHLYGAYPPREIMALDSPSTGFRVLGPAVESIPTLRDYRVCLAPIRFGAGIKGKIADAWAAGVPVVTSPLGAEGMESEADGAFAGMVAESADDFVRKAASAYLDSERGEVFRERGVRALSSLYSEEKNRQMFLGQIDSLLESPERLAEHRRRNLVGRILNQESHGRTKYLSKWIEAKNRGENTV
jgi:O-antigen biosynthesis protein